MVIKKIALIFICMLCSCASLRNLGQQYFKKGNDVAGVEPAEILLVRMKEEQQLRDLMYGQVTTAHIIQCTFLRNQLYVASMSSSNAEVAQAVKLMEHGYQDNNEAFLSACDQIIGTPLGKTFLAIQQEYIGK